jgi:hypothetical protein
MPKHFTMAHWFLFGGGALVFLGLIFWAILPVRPTLPPYLVTGLLALGYGLFCLKRGRPIGNSRRGNPRA